MAVRALPDQALELAPDATCEFHHSITAHHKSFVDK